MTEYGVSERETFSKIYAPGLFVIDDGFRCPGKNDLPLHHEVGPVANRQCFTDIVVRDENSDPAITQGAHQTLDITHRKRVDASKRVRREGRISVPG